MSRYGKLSALLFVSLLGLSLTLPAQAARSVVVLSQQCDYMLLDSTGGQVLVKMIKGQQPQRGDTLMGALKVRDFTDLTNQRNRQGMNVWVDMIDRHGNRALSRYSKYCS